MASNIDGNGAGPVGVPALICSGVRGRGRMGKFLRLVALIVFLIVLLLAFGLWLQNYQGGVLGV